MYAYVKRMYLVVYVYSIALYIALYTALHTMLVYSCDLSYMCITVICAQY